MSKPNVTPQEIADATGMSIEEVLVVIDTVKRAMLPEAATFHIKEHGKTYMFTVERRGLGLLTLSRGTVWQYDFRINDGWEKYSVIVKAEIDRQTLLPVFTDQKQLVLRIDSGCETGQLFHDETCECREQLAAAIHALHDAGEGMVICIPHQDGRGMGLPFKLGTLWLQHELSLNTVQSAKLLTDGAEIDVRTYGGVIGILKFMGIGPELKIDLATNNPRKVQIFKENGYDVDKMIPVVIPPTKHTARHLQAKHDHLGHTNLAGSDNNTKDVS